MYTRPARKFAVATSVSHRKARDALARKLYIYIHAHVIYKRARRMGDVSRAIYGTILVGASLAGGALGSRRFLNESTPVKSKHAEPSNFFLLYWYGRLDRWRRWSVRSSQPLVLSSE